MKRIVFVFACLIAVCLSVQGQEASKVLDKTAATLKAAGNTKIGFTYEASGASSTGYIKLQGQKFVVNMAGRITWFDGKTMWSYVKKNEEVNVTTPSAEEVAKMNPYAFLTFYKHGYTARMGNSSSKEYEVVLTGEESSAYKWVVIRINKSTHLPGSIQLTTPKGGTTVIRCNSFLKNQKYQASTFQFNKKNYPKAEIVDLR